MKTLPLGKAIVLLVAALGLLSTTAAQQADPLLDDIQARIRIAEQQQAELQSDLDFFEDCIRNLQSGEYVVWMSKGALRDPSDTDTLRLAMPIPRVTFDWFLNRLVQERKLPPAEGERLAALERAQSANATRDFIAMASQNIAEIEAKLRPIKDELAYLYDQRSRRRESLDTYNPTRNCNWRPCKCQWLADTCTGGAIMGTTLKSCEQWGGTYWHTNSHCGRGVCSFSKVCPMEGHWCCE